MTEQELTALAQKWNRYGDEGLVTAVGHDAMALAEGYLALLAEREDLKEALGGALKECREHNGDYHWRTSDAVLDEWRTMLTRLGRDEMKKQHSAKEALREHVPRAAIAFADIYRRLGHQWRLPTADVEATPELFEERLRSMIDELPDDGYGRVERGPLSVSLERGRGRLTLGHTVGFLEI